MKTVIRRTIFLLLAISSILAAFYGYLYWGNNQDVLMPPSSEFIEARDLAKEWVLANQDKVLSDPNPMLWWMIKQSQLIGSDEDLKKLYIAYTTNFQQNFPNSAWSKLIHPDRFFRLNIDEVLQYPDYNQHIIYGLTCDNELAELDIIKEQNKASFCGTYHPISPACVTHQMMGIYFIHQNNCLSEQTTLNLMSNLQNRVTSQLEHDPRLVDVYLQRVMMLLLTNKKDQIKPIWIKRILDSQSSDGGWDDFEGLINVGNNNEFGFTKKSLGIRKPSSDFHATAQGLLIFSILANQ